MNDLDHITWNDVDNFGTPLEIGDLVWFRKYSIDGSYDIDDSYEFNRLGIVKGGLGTQYIDVLTVDTGTYLEKYNTNLKKMTDEEALLWKLEH